MEAVIICLLGIFAYFILKDLSEIKETLAKIKNSLDLDEENEIRYKKEE